MANAKQRRNNKQSKQSRQRDRRQPSQPAQTNPTAPTQSTNNQNLNEIVTQGVHAQINTNAMTMPDGRDYWVGAYVSPIDGPEAADDTMAMLRIQPSLLENFATIAQERHITEMVKEVEKNPARVYENTSPEYLITVANRHIGDDDYKGLTSALKNDRGIKTAFLKIHPEAKILKELVAMASKETVKGGAENAHTRITNNEYRINGIIDENTGDVDMVGAAKYDANKVAELPRDEQIRNYTEVGSVYTSIKAPEHFPAAQ